MRRIAAGVLVTLASAVPADAQELITSFSAYQTFGIGDLDGELPPSAEFRFSQRLGDRFAIEPFITIGSTARRSVRTEGFYGAYVRQRIRSLTRDRTYAFVTYGAAGYYSRYDLLPPIIGHIGFGLHQRVADRLAFRPEAQLVTWTVIPIGTRLLAGLSVDLDP